MSFLKRLMQLARHCVWRVSAKCSEIDQNHPTATHHQSHAFRHLLRMLFSTRAFGLLNTCARVEKNIAIFDFNYRDISTQLSRCFFALFRTIRKVRPNTLEYQCVATAILVRKIWAKITAFLSLSFPSNFRKVKPSTQKKTPKTSP